MTRKKSPAPRKNPPKKRPSRKPKPPASRPASKKAKEGGPSRNGEARGARPSEPPPSDIPFDKAYFERQFPNLLRPPAEETPAVRSFVVTLVLGDGLTQLDVQKVEQLDEHWMLVAVLEQDDPYVGRAATSHRFVFVPYVSIARVEVTGAETRLHPIGFHRRAEDESAAEGAPERRGRPRKKAKKTKAAKRAKKRPSPTTPRKRRKRTK